MLLFVSKFDILGDYIKRICGNDSMFLSNSSNSSYGTVVADEQTLVTGEEIPP